MLPVGAAFTACLHIVLCTFTPLVHFHVGEQLVDAAFTRWFLTHDANVSNVPTYDPIGAVEVEASGSEKQQSGVAVPSGCFRTNEI